jgi:hypothetical protein
MSDAREKKWAPGWEKIDSGERHSGHIIVDNDDGSQSAIAKFKCPIIGNHAIQCHNALIGMNPEAIEELLEAVEFAPGELNVVQILRFASDRLVNNGDDRLMAHIQNMSWIAGKIERAVKAVKHES